MRKVSRAQEQLSLFNFKTATKVHDWNPARADISDHTIETPCLDCGEKMDHPNHASMGTPEPFTNARNSNKTAVNLNIVHDVATMAPHVWNGIKDVGHGIADVAKGVWHGVSSIGHNDIDLAKTVGESITSHNPDNSPDNINHVLYNYLSSPSVGRFPVGTPHHEIYNMVQHWRANGGQMGGNALHNYPGLDKASSEILSQDLKNKFDAMEGQAGYQFVKDVGSAALTGLAPTAIGLGIKQHREKFSSFDDRYAFEKTAKEEGEKGFKPPAGVQSAARHALKLIEEGKAGDGFTSVGRGRAHQLANGETLSLSTVKRMHSYFSRHRVDKKGKDWDNNSPGKVAWLAWGGDAGASWAAGICAKHDGNDKD